MYSVDARILRTRRPCTRQGKREVERSRTGTDLGAAGGKSTRSRHSLAWTGLTGVEGGEGKELHPSCVSGMEGAASLKALNTKPCTQGECCLVEQLCQCDRPPSPLLSCASVRQSRGSPAIVCGLAQGTPRHPRTQLRISMVCMSDAPHRASGGTVRY